MASTGNERILLMDQEAFKMEGYKNLLDRIMRLKLADGIHFKTVRDYLIENYNDNIEFDASKLMPLLVDRVKDTEQNYLNEVNYTNNLNKFIETELSDFKYSEQVMKDATSSLSFIQWLKGGKVGAVSFDDKTIAWGPKRITIEEAFNKFTDLTNVYDQKAKDALEAEYLNEQRETVYYMFQDIAMKNGLSQEEVEKFLSEDEGLRNYLFNELIETSVDYENELANGTIESKVVEKANSLEVKKMETSIDNRIPVPERVEEMDVDNLGVSTKSTSLPTTVEREALYAGLSISYNDSKNIDRVVNNAQKVVAGPEDGEETVVDEPEFETVQVKDEQPPIEAVKTK